MSYEIVREQKVMCPCKQGFIKRVVKENDFFQQKEDIDIVCQYCKSLYKVKVDTLKSKPKHEMCIYYLISKEENDNRQIKLEF